VAPEAPGAGPRPAAVCAAPAARGILYALATLEQASQPAAGAPGAWEVPRLAAVDRPAVPLRGVAECFPKAAWSPAARLAMIPFLARHKMNFYLHAPSDEAVPLARWREPISPKVLAHLRDIAGACAVEQVDFACGLRPGESIRYSDGDDARLLAARTDAVRPLGVRRFALLFDNLPPDLRQRRDRETFPDLAAAQAQCANLLLAHLRRSDAASRLYVLPTEPWGLEETSYRRSLRERLDPAIEVFWNGPNVVAKSLNAVEAAQAAERWGRPPVLWDNYPLTYHAPHRVFLGPLRGRDAGSAERLAGYAAVPMPLAEASKIALATAADFAWNPRTYDPGRAWAAALDEAAGRPAAARAALRALAENSQSSWIHAVESPGLAALLQACEEKGEAAPLERALAELAAVRGTLEASLPNRGLAAELAPWSARLEWRARQAQESLRLAAPLREGKAGEVWARRLAIGSVTRPPAGLPARAASVEVCGRLLAAFAARRAEEADRWLGLGPASVTTSLPALESFAPSFAADGNAATAFASSRPPAEGDHVTLDLGRPRPVCRVELRQGAPDRPDDYVRAAALEASADGRAWREIGSVAGAETEADLAQPVTARYVRLRVLKPQAEWAWIREFAARVLDDPTVQTTFPAPPEKPGLDAAIDRRAETVFATAGPAPAGAHVTVDLRETREVSLVSVLQAPDAALPAGRVLLSKDGQAWEEAGALAGAATRLAFEKPRAARFVRVEATAPCEGPVRIHEIGIIWQ
jgi:hyaluronoglucosaminidase